MSKGNIILLSILGLALCFCVVMLIQSYAYPQSTLQEMRPIARGTFTIYRDCYNAPQYYMDANPLPLDWSVGRDFYALKMDNRKEGIYVTSLKEGSEYNLYVREGLLKNYYFVECVN